MLLHLRFLLSNFLLHLLLLLFEHGPLSPLFSLAHYLPHSSASLSSSPSSNPIDCSPMSSAAHAPHLSSRSKAREVLPASYKLPVSDDVSPVLGPDVLQDVVFNIQRAGLLPLALQEETPNVKVGQRLLLVARGSGGTGGNGVGRGWEPHEDEDKEGRSRSERSRGSKCERSRGSKSERSRRSRR
eukprot:706650-Hanusia_phi.AAC.2